MTQNRYRVVLERLGRESTYLLLSWPILLTAFVVLITLAATGLGLLVVWVGVPILMATVALARLIAQAERATQHVWLGRPPIQEAYRPGAPGETWWQRVRRMATDPQHGLDLVFGLFAWVVSTVTWCLAITWWSIAIAGLTTPLWWFGIPLPDDAVGPARLLFGVTSSMAAVVGNVLLGLLAALTLPAVIHGLTLAQTQLFGAILGSSALQARVDDLRTSRDAAQDAEAGALRKLERDLHDGPQQRLVRLQMDLGRARTKLADNPAAAGPALDSALAQAKATLDELRLLSRGIASPILLDRGLAAALDDLVARSAIPARLTTNLHGQEGQVPVRVQNATYYLVSEALTNAAKHSGAPRVDVDAHLSEQMLRVTVRDEGRGGAAFATGTGLVGLRDRVRGLDGRLDISSPPGGPTVLTALLPADVRG